MSVVRNSVLAFLPHVAGLVAGLLSSIITARYLGASGRGVLTLVLMALGVLLLVSDGGVSASVTYLVSAGRLDRRQALRLCIGASACLGAIGLGLAALAWLVLSTSAFAGVSLAQYIAALIALPAMLFTTFWSRLSMAKGEFAPVLRLQSSVSAGGLLLTFIVLLIANRGVFELVAALSVMHWIAATWLYLSEHHSHGAPAPLPAGTLSETLSYGSRSYLGSLVSYATLRIDAFVLNTYWGSAAVGRYTIAVTLTEKLWLVDSSVGQAAMPEVISRGSERAAGLVATANRAVVALTLAGGAVLFFAAPLMIRLLYGAEYGAAAAAVRILIPGAIAYASGRTLLHYHQGHLARPGTVSAVMGVSALIGIGLYFVLIPKWGINGAAMASSIAYLSVLVMAAVLFLRETGLSIREAFVPGRKDFLALRDRLGRRTGSNRSE